MVTVKNLASAGTISAPKDTICAGTITHLTLNGNSIGNIQWQSADSMGLFNSISGATGTTYTTGPLSQLTNFRVVVSGSNLCSDSTAYTIWIKPSPLAAYTYNIIGNEALFNSSGSKGAISYSWSFGDDSTSTDENPTHTYAGSGTYYVCLTTENKTNCDFSFCEYITIIPLGTNDLNTNGNWQVSPNPVNQTLFVTLPGNGARQQVQIFNTLGVLLKEFEISKSAELNIADLPAGLYFVHVINSSISQKIIKN